MEQLKTLFADKSLKPKDLTTQLSQLVLEGQVNSDELMDFASKAKDPVRAVGERRVYSNVGIDLAVATMAPVSTQR